MPIETWRSYPSIYAMGHAALAELLLDPVLVEEKIDGSQFSWGVFDMDEGRVVKIRSKGAEMYPDAPEKMFSLAATWVREHVDDLHPGWTYRAEYLAKPRHNTLPYDRVPRCHLMLFDVTVGHEAYLPWEQKAAEADRLGLEVVPVLQDGRVESIEAFREFLTRDSVLGGSRIEGVVVKNYQRFGRDKRVLMGKFVSETFKETHGRVWAQDNPGPTDIIDRIIGVYRSPARWAKAVQHLREKGGIEDSPRDIGLLIREVWPDIERECEGEIRDALYAWAKDKLRRGVTHGLPEWYKERLLERQFDPNVATQEGA